MMISQMILYNKLNNIQKPISNKMACVDKLYTNNYKDYIKLKEWCRKQEVVFFDGHKEYPIQAMYEWKEKDFYNTERPIILTREWLDAFLYNNCPFDFVQNWLKEIYLKEDLERFKKTDLSKIPEGFEQNRKIIIKNLPETKVKLCNIPISGSWWLESEEYYFNRYTNRCIHRDILYPWTSNVYRKRKTVKSVIRFLRKQYLKKDTTFKLIGNYVGEDYLIIIK